MPLSTAANEERVGSENPEEAPDREPEYRTHTVATHFASTPIQGQHTKPNKDNDRSVNFSFN